MAVCCCLLLLKDVAFESLSRTQIEKGTLRFASITSGAGDFEVPYWRKMTCMTKAVAQNALNFYDGDITQLRDWDLLDAATQAEVRSVFDNLLAGKPPYPDGDDAAPAPKEKKAAAKKKKKADSCCDDDDDDLQEVKPKKKAAKKAKKAAAPAVAMPDDDA